MKQLGEPVAPSDSRLGEVVYCCWYQPNSSFIVPSDASIPKGQSWTGVGVLETEGVPFPTEARLELDKPEIHPRCTLRVVVAERGALCHRVHFPSLELPGAFRSVPVRCVLELCVLERICTCEADRTIRRMRTSMRTEGRDHAQGEVAQGAVAQTVIVRSGNVGAVVA